MAPPEPVRKAWDYAVRNRNRFVTELKELVRQPSISAQNVGLKECAELVRQKMSNLGIRAKVIKVSRGPGIVYGELRGKRDAKTLVVYNHYDVQPVEPLDEWRSDPFKPTVRNGRLFGRGAGDDKGELVARFNAVESVLNTEGSLKPNLKWVVEGEEEIGSPHLHSFVTKNKGMLRGDGCLWEEGDRTASGTAEVHLGVKGLLYVEFTVRFGKKDLHSMYGPIAPNPAWRLVNLLRTIKDENGAVKIKGFYDDAVRPTLKEKEFIKNNEFSSDDLRRALEIDYLLKERTNVETVTKLLYDPSANIAGFGSGYLGEGAKTIVPKEAFVKMDFRLVANMQAHDILSKLRTHMKRFGFTDVGLKIYSEEDPAKTSVDSYIAQAVIKASTMAEGRRPNVWPTIPGTGPLSLFTKTLRLPTAMGLGVNYAGAGFHAPNEHVVLDYYHRGIKQMICFLSIF